MALNTDDIARIANLARLELAPDQAAQMLVQLNSFFEIVEQISTVDTSGIEPLAHPAAAIEEVQLRLRPDRANPSEQRELNQQNAPAVERGLFLVPQVIE